MIIGAVAAVSACTMPASYLGYALVGETKQPIAANDAHGRKIGRACGRNIAMIVATGDYSVEAAKANGKITRVATVDMEVRNYIVFAEVCTVVTGE